MDPNLIQNQRIISRESRVNFTITLEVLKKWVIEVLLHLLIVELFNSYIIRFLGRLGFAIIGGALLVFLWLYMHYIFQLQLLFFFL